MAVYLDYGSSMQFNLKEPSSKEIWVSFDVYYIYRSDFYVSFGDNLPYFYIDSNGYMYVKNKKETLYVTQDNIGDNTHKKMNIEIHLKTGEEGRIDAWKDTKLIFSYRSPTSFPDIVIPCVQFKRPGNFSSAAFAHFILQDTRRIGLEKFKKLTIDPDTEQNMPQGSTTTYKLSGLSDATEFSDITSVCAVLQATSRDTNISTGTFSLEGADVGTVDVSDSSGKAYEIAYAETNSLTGKPWTRDDIEGKTLSFKVNGAS